MNDPIYICYGGATTTVPTTYIHERKKNWGEK